MKQIGLFSKIAPLGLFLILCAFFAIGLTKDPRALPSNLIDKAMPAFELSDVYDEARNITETSLTGKVTILNVFGSWCQGCLIEHPTFLKLQNRQDIQIVGVNWRDSRANALRWLGRFGDPYKFVLFDEDSDLAIELGVTGAPETYVVGPDLRIKYKHVGAVTDEVFENKIAPLILTLNAEGKL